MEYGKNKMKSGKNNKMYFIGLFLKTNLEIF